MGIPIHPVQHPCGTCSSSLIILARPRTPSSLCILYLLIFFNMSHLVSGISSLVLSVNLIPVTLSLTCLFPTPATSSYSVSTPLTINNSLSLSLPAQNLPLPQIFPTTDSLPASGLTSRTSGLFPLLIFPCTIKSRSSVLAPAHPGGPGKGP